MPKVCGDAGHGGRDSGAVDGTYNDRINSYEKNYTLDCLMQFDAALNASYIPTVSTRVSDIYPTLQQRCDISNNAHADIFVSWHFDSAGLDGSPAKGISILYCSAEGKKLAQDIFDAIAPVSPWQDRGLKLRTDLYVLNHTKAPAVIIEGGFLTNSDEEALIATSSYRVALAEAAARGVCNHFGIPYITRGLYGTENALYRFLRNDGNAHFYTMSPDEARKVSEIDKTHVYEGVSWIADPRKNHIPLNRLYNSEINQHHYTTSDTEIATMGSKWHNEGVACYVSDTGVPVYRAYNPANYDHLHTVSEAEYNLAVAHGWTPENTPYCVAV